MYTNKQIWSVSYPILLSLLAQNVINVTDTAFLGHVSEVALGASAMGGLFYICIFTIAFGFSTGSQIVIARRNGEGRYSDVGPVMIQGIMFLLLIAILMFGFTKAFGGNIMRLLVSSESIYEGTMEFLDWRIYGFFFSFVNVMFRALYIGITRTKVLTINAVVMALTNVILDYALIFGKFGLPEMGIKGAAIASVLAEASSILFFLIYTYISVDLKKYGLNRLRSFDPALLMRILSISCFTMLQYFLSMATWFVFFVAVFAMGKLTALLYERYKAGKLPLTLQSTDNCSHNGDHVKAGVKAYAERWAQDGIVEAGFLDYINDSSKITYPWSMIDKITPRPHEKVQAMLVEDGFEDNNTIITEKHTFTAPFVNAEEVQYLVCEDTYTNGRPPLELGGALYTTRKTVDEVETMKVTTCLNPLHTAMSIYGCMLDYTLISAEMADEDLRAFIQKIGYIEAMPVVTDPGVLNPYEFIGTVINKRLPNPFMPDAPQRIATDTSQKLSIRFGETIKKYIDRGLDKSNLVLIPLVLAGYARYLKALDDNLKPFEPSSDPLLAELQAIVAPLEVGKADQDYSCLKNLYSRKDVFGLDLYEAGFGEQIEGMVKELFAGEGAVRKTLHKYVSAR